MTQHYDLVVIGAGPGGYIAALRAAQLGLKTACIDKRLDPGGTCLNVGCIPSKTLLQSTELYVRLQESGEGMGLKVPALDYDWNQMLKRKNQVVKGLVDSVRALFTKNHVDFINGEARLLNSHVVEIKQADGKVHSIEAQNIILATGSEPISLRDLPIDEKQILSSTGALSLSKVPQRLVVIGGGVIGVELASVYRRLGSEVTIIEMLDHICPALDKALSQSLLQILKKQGIKFHLKAQVLTTVLQPDEVILTIQQEDKLFNLSADVVLVAIGRKPSSKGLNLEGVGVQLSPRGYVMVDKVFRTKQSNIFAIGDLIEGTMLAHRAEAEAVAVVERIAGYPVHAINYLAIPNVIYTYPEVASVGLSEEEAHASGLDLLLGVSSFKGNARARCSSELEGFVKVIGEKKTGRVVGMHIIGAHASELIAEGMLAMEKKATVHDLAYSPQAHPTLSEAIKEAALAALGQPIHF